MQLFLDRGNSSVKWGAHDGDWVAGGRLPLDREGHVPAEALAKLPRVDTCWLASVARDERDAALVAQLDEQRGISVERIVSEAEAAGVRCAYEDPSRLGVDRWLGVIAAFEPGRPALVIDAGTAITLDVVDAEGQHLGGLIAPGIRLMREALYANTDRIPDEGEAMTDLLGTDTRSAVTGGTLQAAVGLVDRVVSRLQQETPGIRCMVTGGDAERLLPHLQVRAEHAPRLVLEGMRRVAEDKRKRGEKS